ncbi:MAG: hypothetical protein LBD34_02345 [Puniceicoccales bacterium]|nr:hypothetical protein [Puniceicoccales bacterium]
MWLFLVRAAQESLCEIPHGEEVYGTLRRVLALRKDFFEDVKAKIRTLEEVLEKTRKSLEKQVKQLALMSPMSPKRTKREVPTVDTTPIPFKVTSSSSSEGGYKYDKGLK